VKLVGNGKRVLDVGCSSGELAGLLKANDCSIVGIEYDPEAAEKAKERCDQVIVADLEAIENFPFKEKEFDHILFMDVLEHLRDPSSILKRLRPFLKTDGTVIISIPNIANQSIRFSLLFGRWNYAEYGILDRTHLRFFTRKTAITLVTEAGFAIKRVDVTPGVPLLSRIYRKPYITFNYVLSKAFQTMFATQFIISASPHYA
jgi:2-polyprenyl-3-methyl-5-hydroxy-6-metoxy-1,4-benzoquinol methylase